MNIAQWNRAWELAQTLPDWDTRWGKHPQCEICGHRGKLHQDHNHKTGKKRGKLCCRCNTKLVAMLEHPLAEDAKRYLRRYA